VVNQTVDSSSVHYAIIAGLRTETGPERLVIEYTNEKSLSDLIAGPSIIGAGFASREDAVASSRAPMPPAASYRQVPSATVDRNTERYRQTLERADRQGEMSSTLRRLARCLTNSYSNAAITAAIIFSSRSLVSAIVRMALGSPA
jgi:hypothetical protein